MDISILKTEILSNDQYVLKKVTYAYHSPDGREQVQHKEAYDRGDAAAILLYDTAAKKVILTRQFRLPPYITHGETALIEVCAGKLDGDTPEAAIRRECMEETGYKIDAVEKIMEAYTSPASVTELMHLFIAAYNPGMKTGKGGGLEEEQEYIEVLEMHYEEALQLVKAGQIRDAKTIILLQYLRGNGIL